MQLLVEPPRGPPVWGSHRQKEELVPRTETQQDGATRPRVPCKGNSGSLEATTPQPWFEGRAVYSILPWAQGPLEGRHHWVPIRGSSPQQRTLSVDILIILLMPFTPPNNARRPLDYSWEDVSTEMWTVAMLRNLSRITQPVAAASVQVSFIVEKSQHLHGVCC